MGLFEKALQADFWKRVREDKLYQNAVKSIKVKYEANR